MLRRILRTWKECSNLFTLYGQCRVLRWVQDFSKWRVLERQSNTRRNTSVLWIDSLSRWVLRKSNIPCCLRRRISRSDVLRLCVWWVKRNAIYEVRMIQMLKMPFKVYQFDQNIRIFSYDISHDIVCHLV